MAATLFVKLFTVDDILFNVALLYIYFALLVVLSVTLLIPVFIPSSIS